MSAVATAIVGGAVIGAYASKSAASKSAKAANRATDATTARYYQTRDDLLPYNEQGQQASSQLSDFVKDPNNTNFTAQDFQKYQDPSYQWQLQQGQQALQNSQAAQDGVLSGAALKGMQNYTQGMASTNYQNAYNNWFNTTNQNYTRLFNLANLGENAAAQTGSAGASLANTAANSMMAAGNAGAAGTIGAANAVTGSINNGIGYYQLNNLMNNGSGAAAQNQFNNGMSGYNTFSYTGS